MGAEWLDRLRVAMCIVPNQGHAGYDVACALRGPDLQTDGAQAGKHLGTLAVRGLVMADGDTCPNEKDAARWAKEHGAQAVLDLVGKHAPAITNEIEYAPWHHWRSHLHGAMRRLVEAGVLDWEAPESTEGGGS